MIDVLVIGSGPAGAALAAALCERGLRVGGLSPAPAASPWPNTYGMWEDELAPLGLSHLLAHRWTDVSVFMGPRPTRLRRVYGLLDNARLQAHLLAPAERGGVAWEVGKAAGVEVGPRHASVRTQDGREIQARAVVDASGHSPALVRRPERGPVAAQAAYGVVGTFSAPPVRPGELVLMDFRDEFLPAAERSGPPTFLYAMDMGGGTFFAEETSLAAAPAVPLAELERRMHLRLAHHGVAVREVQHVERCLFPMNLPLPHLDQPVMGYGGAASMVHPASGYQVGAALRNAPVVAAAIAQALDAGAGPAGAARAAWGALWPAEKLRRRALYEFGLSCLLTFDAGRLRRHFTTFFHLPLAQWSGYLSDRLETPDLARTMLRLFFQSPWDHRLALARSATGDLRTLARALL